MRQLMRLKHLMGMLRLRLREWSGDDAYERYCQAHHGHGHALVSRRAFYREYLDRRGNRPRCC